jgi:hypothetical protein
MPASVGLVLLSLFFVEAHVAHAAEEPVWTLDAAVRQALTVAPESVRQRLMAAREGALKQAGAWPNPQSTCEPTRKLGIEDGGGGPISHRSRSRSRCRSHASRPSVVRPRDNLAAARERLRQVRLVRETEAARAFHTLQLTQARLQTRRATCRSSKTSNCDRAQG